MGESPFGVADLLHNGKQQARIPEVFLSAPLSRPTSLHAVAIVASLRMVVLAIGAGGAKEQSDMTDAVA